MNQLKDISGYTLMIFIQVYEHRSFSLVSRIESVAPSSISRIILQLEKKLGQQLFYRNTRSLIPTENAEILIHYARKITSQLNEAIDEIQNSGNDAQGLVRINAPILFGQLHIAPWLVELNSIYPNLEIELILSDDFIDPYKKTTDIIFRISQLLDSGFHARVIHKVQYHLVASPKYIKKFGTLTSPKDLAQHKCLVYQGSQGMNKWYFKQKNSFANVQLNTILRSNNAESLRIAALNGLGLVLFPDWIIGNDLKHNNLKKLLSDYTCSISLDELHIAAIYPQTQKMPKKVRVVIDFFIKKFGRPTYWQYE